MEKYHMKFKNKNKLFLLAIGLAAVLGIIIGAGSALASESIFTLSSGSYGYSSTHSDTYPPPPSSLSDSYTEYQYVYRNAGSTEVTVSTTNKYSGSSSYPDYMAYGNMWIYDEYGQHTVSYQGYNYYSTRLISGINHSVSTYWDKTNLNTGNNHVITQQDIWLEDFGGVGYTTIGADYDVYYTGIGSP
jgi:hypothetical protein